MVVRETGVYRGLVLDLIRPEDHGALYALFMEGEGAMRWRFRGATPSYDEFAQALWQSIFAHFLVRRYESGRVIGYVAAYGAQVRDRHCYVAFIGVPEVRNRGSMVFGMGLFVETLFRMAPFRKLYAEATAENLAQYRRAVDDDLVQVEGTYPEHEWANGRIQTVHTLALYRRTWAARRAHFGWTGDFDPEPR